MSDDEYAQIVLRPITWHWSDWVDRHRVLTGQVDTWTKIYPNGDLPQLMTFISTWNKEAEAHLAGLNDDQKKDVIDLMMAEIEMLWIVADPAGYAPLDYTPGPPSEADRANFRERYYIVLPLLTIAERLKFDRSDVVRRALGDLEHFAMNTRGWLP